MRAGRRNALRELAVSNRCRSAMRLGVVESKSGECVMKVPSNLLAAAALAIATASSVAPAGVAPIAAPSALHNATASSVETVAWRGGWRGRGWAPAAVAGAVVGGAIAAAQPWNWGYGAYGYPYDSYAYYPGYGYGYDYAPTYSYSPGYNAYAYSPGGDSDDAYCSQRFRSYDPSSGTYMGYDGRRHSCP
jgi:hypothetical protein